MSILSLHNIKRCGTALNLIERESDGTIGAEGLPIPPGVLGMHFWMSWILYWTNYHRYNRKQAAESDLRCHLYADKPHRGFSETSPSMYTQCYWRISVRCNGIRSAHWEYCKHLAIAATRFTIHWCFVLSFEWADSRDAGSILMWSDWPDYS